MPLGGSHWIWGYLLSSTGEGISGQTIQVLDYDSYQGTGETTTNTDGYFQINIQEYVDEGNTIIITCSVGGDTVSEFIVIDLDELTQNVTLQFSELDGDKYAISYMLEGVRIWISKSLNKPYYAEPSNSIKFSTRVLNLWDKSLDVESEDMESDTVIIRGWENKENISAFANTLNNVLNEGRYIYIHYLGDKLNGKYIIKRFSLKTVKGTNEILDYEFELEPSGDR